MAGRKPKKKPENETPKNGEAKPAEAEPAEARPIVEVLDCKLTAKELAGKVAEFAEKRGKLRSLEARLKDHKDDFGRRIKTLEAEIDAVADVVREGTEKRKVECEWQKDFAQNVKRLVRLDTLETVEERALTAHERQMDIEDAKAKKTKPAPAEATA